MKDMVFVLNMEETRCTVQFDTIVRKRKTKGRVKRLKRRRLDLRRFNSYVQRKKQSAISDYFPGEYHLSSIDTSPVRNSYMSFVRGHFLGEIGRIVPDLEDGSKPDPVRSVVFQAFSQQVTELIISNVWLYGTNFVKKGVLFKTWVKLKQLPFRIIISCLSLTMESICHAGESALWAVNKDKPNGKLTDKENKAKNAVIAEFKNLVVFAFWLLSCRYNDAEMMKTRLQKNYGNEDLLRILKMVEGVPELTDLPFSEATLTHCSMACEKTYDDIAGERTRGCCNELQCKYVLIYKEIWQYLCQCNGKREYLCKNLLRISAYLDLEEELRSRVEKSSQKVDEGGRKRREAFPSYCQEFIKKNYPDIEIKNYHFPLAFEYDSFNLKKDVKSLIKSHKQKKLKIKLLGEVPLILEYDSSHDKEKVKSSLRGDIANEVVFKMICSMLDNTTIPSFVIAQYKWYTNLQRCLSILKHMGKPFKRGDVDVLVITPKYLAIVEVKAANEQTINVEEDEKSNPVTCASNQCERSVEVLTLANCDLLGCTDIRVIKVVALPNCSKEGDINLPPHSHVLFKEDFKNTETLHAAWINIVNCGIRQLDPFMYDISLYINLLGRLLGPENLVETEESVAIRSHKYIAEYSKIKRKSLSYKIEKLYTNAKFVWMTGVPGSGKSELMNSKIQELLGKLNKRHTIVIISPNKAMSKKWTDGSYNNTNTPIVRSEVYNKPCNFYKFIYKFIIYFQQLYKDKTVHFFFQESPMLAKGVDLLRLKKLWHERVDDDRLGHVWISQNATCTELDYKENNDINYKEKIFQPFQRMHLKYIMRIPIVTVNLLNFLFDKDYPCAHCINGNIPIMYTLTCICSSHGTSLYCEKCSIVRLTLVIIKILKECFNIKPAMANSGQRIKNFVILTKYKHQIQLVLKHLPDGSFWASNILPILYDPLDFVGCEAVVVITDMESISSPASALDCFASVTGQLILCNTGISNDDVSVRALIEKASRADFRIRIIKCMSSITKHVLDNILKEIQMFNVGDRIA